MARRRSTNQGVAGFPSKFLPEKLDDSLEPIRRADLVEILPHNGGISYGLETNDDCKPDRWAMSGGV